LENYINKRFISFKMPAKQEQAMTWWNSAAQMCPVLDSSSFAPILMLPRWVCLHSASSVLTVCISCCIIAVFLFRKPLFINWTWPYLMLHKYSIQYYPQFHITAVGLGTYYSQILGHICILAHHSKGPSRSITPYQILESTSLPSVKARHSHTYLLTNMHLLYKLNYFQWNYVAFLHNICRKNMLC
jgi:hypothetical protein